MKPEWMNWIKMPAYNAEGASSPSTAGAAGGQAAPAAAAPATANQGGDAGGQSAGTYFGQMKADASAAPEDAGETPPEQDGETPPETEGQEGEGTTEPDAPTEFALEAPEGMTEYAADFEAYSTASNEWLQANPDATAEDALRFAAEYQGNRVEQLMQDIANAPQENADKWESDLRADPSFGGADYDANVAIAVRAIDQLGSDDLKDQLSRTGLGSHPDLVKAFYEAGKLLSEAPVAGQAQGAAKKSFSNALYPNS